MASAAPTSDVTSTMVVTIVANKRVSLGPARSNSSPRDDVVLGSTELTRPSASSESSGKLPGCAHCHSPVHFFFSWVRRARCAIESLSPVSFMAGMTLARRSTE